MSLTEHLNLLPFRFGAIGELQREGKYLLDFMEASFLYCRFSYIFFGSTLNLMEDHK